MVTEIPWGEFREKQLQAEINRREHTAPIGELFEWLASKKVKRNKVQSEREMRRMVMAHKANR